MPEELITDVPSIGHCRVLGSKAFVYNNLPPAPGGKKKAEATAMKGILVGYTGIKLYGIYVLERKKVMVTRDVVFYEPENNEEII